MRRKGREGRAIASRDTIDSRTPPIRSVSVDRVKLGRGKNMISVPMNACFENLARDRFIAD
jgi:hypothetical protein